VENNLVLEIIVYPKPMTDGVVNLFFLVLCPPLPTFAHHSSNKPPPGHSSTFSDDMLPSWARPAAQEALIELQKRQIAFEKDGKSILLPNGQVNQPEDKSSVLEDAALDAANNDDGDSDDWDSDLGGGSVSGQDDEDQDEPLPMIGDPLDVAPLELAPENIDLPDNTSVYEIDPSTTIQYRILDQHDQLGGFDGTTNARTGEGLAEAAGANLRGVAIEQGKDEFSVVVSATKFYYVLLSFTQFYVGRIGCDTLHKTNALVSISLPTGVAGFFRQC
jgi:hypothetical protein